MSWTWPLSNALVGTLPRDTLHNGPTLPNRPPDVRLAGQTPSSPGQHYADLVSLSLVSMAVVRSSTYVRGGEDKDVRPYKKENSEEDKTVNAEQSSSKRRQPLSAEQLAKREWLAGEMLKVLKDKHSLGFYRKVAATMPEHRVLEALSEIILVSREGRLRQSKGRSECRDVSPRRETHCNLLLASELTGNPPRRPSKRYVHADHQRKPTC